MADIGATLREARMRARIDINEVEIRTKIRAKYLRAMENEEWDLLPGDVYVRSFLRTYGDFLGLDSRQLIDDYKRRFERPSDHELRPIAPLGRDRERRSRGPRRPRIPSWFVIVVVLAGILAALYFVGVNNGGPSTPTTTTHATVHHPRHTTHRRTRIVATRVRLQLVPTGAVYVCLIDGTGHKLIPGQIFNIGQTIPTKTAPKLLLTLGNAAVRMKVNGTLVRVPATGRPVGFELTPDAHTVLPAAKQATCA
ncbi:MAG: helix-turn-helix domain-containing protein [Solirubrobacteraceae bacterium]